MQKRHLCAAAALTAFALAPLHGQGDSAAVPSSAPHFTVTDLGTLPGGDHSGAYGINNSGQIVGWSDGGRPHPKGDSLFDDHMIHNRAVLWDQGQARDLGLLQKAIPYSAATAINNKSQIVGGWELHFVQGYGGSIGGPRQTFFWQHDKRTVRYFEGNLSFDKITAINDSGEIVGQGTDSHGDYPQHPLAQIHGTIIDLALLPGATEGCATGINAAGDVVGWEDGPAANGKNNDYVPFVYHNGKLTRLDNAVIGASDGPTLSQAFAINNHGVIVGLFRGFGCIWKNGEHTFLNIPLPDTPQPESYSSLCAYAINNHDEVVGTANASGLYQHDHAFVYDGAVHDLNDLIPASSGWVLKEARGINDKGQIVGEGLHNGNDRAFLLTPGRA